MMVTWTYKRARAASYRSIEAAIKHISAVAHQWGDVDEGIVFDCDTLINKMDALKKTINESVELGQMAREDE